MAERYDVIVIGGGVAGLATAALAARRGVRPLVLEQGEGLGGACATVVRDRYRFDAGAGLLWGFEEGRSARGFLEQVGAPVEALPLDPGFQVVLPRHRVSFHRNDERFWREVRREVSGGHEAVRAFYAEVQSLDKALRALELGPHDLPPRTPWDRFQEWRRRSREAREFQARAKEPLADLATWRALPAEIRRALTLILRHLGHADPSSPVLPAASILGLTRRGFTALRGGTGTLVAALARAVERHGGAVRTMAKATAVVLRGGHRAVGVRMADGAVLETAAIVGAVAPAVLAELVETERGRVFPEGLPSPETAALTLYLGVDEAILPSEMCPHVFLGLAEPLEPGGIETVSVSASPAWDGGRAPQGRRALTANAFLRLNGGLPAAADWMRMRESVLSALDDFLPGLRSRSDFCEFRTPAAWHEHTGRPSGAAGYAQGSLPAFLGWQGFPHATPIAGLFVAGDWTFPGCSVAAVLKGARRTVDLLQTSRR